MRDLFRITRIAGIAVFVVAYALLVHHVNASGQASTLGAVLALVPLLLIGVALVTRPQSRIPGILFLLTLTALAWWQWPALQKHSSLVFLLQDLSLMLALFATFARTLMPSCKPLCVGFAEAIHGGDLPAAHAEYARQVTVAWVMFFMLMAIASIVLFFFFPLAVWSFFVNFLTLPLVGLMFIVEFFVRRHVLPDAPRVNIFAAVNAYKDMARVNH